MFSPILVPLDGSLLAECSLSHMLAIVRSFDADVTLIHMLEKKETDSSAHMFDLLDWQIKKTEASLYLEKTKARFNESDLHIQMVVQEGLVAEGITEYAQDHGVKLIILSSHGNSGLARWGISNIAQKIILSAPTSVFVIRAQQLDVQADEPPAMASYQRILVPLDGSQRAEHVLPIVGQLAHFHGSKIHLVQVIQTPEMARHLPLTHEDIELSNRIVERNREEAEHYLELAKSRSYLDGLTVHVHLFTSDNAAAELHRVAEQEQVDLVVLNAHGYSGHSGWPLGSMVNNFIMYSHLPILIVQDLPVKPKQTSVEGLPRERAEH
jgi:nucleotide-binding universal stress UspA family protein